MDNPNPYIEQFQNIAACIRQGGANCPCQNCLYFQSGMCPQPNMYKQVENYSAALPKSFAKSMEGKYFVGYADNLTFGNGTNAWARLYNPPTSGVNLHITVWTVSDVSQSPFKAQIYFNASAPGVPENSATVTTTNFTCHPLPRPAVKLQYAKEIPGEPKGGVKSFYSRDQIEPPLVEDEQGKIILPPGGSMLIFLSNAENMTEKATGKIAFAWWEEPIW